MDKYKEFINNGETLHDIAAIDHFSRNIKDYKEYMTDDQLRRIGYEVMKYFKENQSAMFLVNCDFEDWEEDRNDYLPSLTKKIDIDIFPVSNHRWIQFKKTFKDVR